jgi:predicted permease
MTLMDALKAHGRASTAGRHRRIADPLVVLELAACLVLLVGTSLLGRTLLNLEHDQIGLDPDHVLVSRIYPRMAGYTPDTVNGLYSSLRDRLSALPGVEAVSFTRYTPFSGNGSHTVPNVEGYTPSGDETVEMAMVGPQYAEALHIPVRLGRTLDEGDLSSGSRVGVVNEAFVRRFLPGRNPIGVHFAIDRGVTPDTEIVGVLADAQLHNAREPVEPVEFIPTRADYGEFNVSGELMIRLAASAGATASSIRDAVRGVDPNLPMESPHWLRDQVSDTFQTERLSMQLMSGFSGLALVLACVGLYGTLAQRLVRRTGEIGIRLALGASRPQVLGLMMRDALRPLAIGLVLGIPAALAASGLLSTLLFGVSPADPWSIAGAVLALTLVAALAGFIPARRAARVDPMTTLRAE